MAEKRKICDCEICKHHHEFEMPDDLLSDLLEGKVTVFAGAGISTESNAVLKHTFYSSVVDELHSRQSSKTFPELMDEYCKQQNGRFKLIKKIKDRFDHIESFPELKGSATDFHCELGTLFPVRNIVTTNWDTYFEDHCKATPFVTDSDLAFWDAADRRVLKIHGSVTNFGSIVATTDDYRLCRDRLRIGVLGGLLKTILATQAIVFTGYSLSDFDFADIYGFVKEQMGPFHKQSYVITPNRHEGETFEREGIFPIITDGTYFLRQIKKHAVAKGVMLDDEIYEAASELLDLVVEEHRKLHRAVKAQDFPELIYAASYQDGMKHALERALTMRGTGQYSQETRIIGTIKAYLQLEKEKLHHGVYEDVAYIEGYVNGLTYLLADRKRRKQFKIPLYYMLGVDTDIVSLADFVAILKNNPCAHKASLKRARRWLRRLSEPQSIQFHHPPWL